MTSLLPQELKALQPYIVGKPNEEGWADMICPLHADGHRSAGVNFETGWYKCFAGCGSGDVSQLLRVRSAWIDPAAGGGLGSPQTNGHATSLPSERSIDGFHAALLSERRLLATFVERRGIAEETLIRYRIGYDRAGTAFTIPVYDRDGKLLNVRRYQMDAPDDRRKIWSVKGHGTPALYPMDQLDAHDVIICEGEWDSLLTIQHGLNAITRTGSAGTWRSSWGPLFKDKNVWICQDCDSAGQKGQELIGQDLEKHAASVRILRLPYAITEKHGKDLTDYWLDGHTADDLRTLMDEALPFGDERTTPTVIPDARVMDAFDSRRAGEPMQLTVTVRGKGGSGYTVPSRGRLKCTQDAGLKCNVCAMKGHDGELEFDLPSSHPVVLEVLDSTAKQMRGIMARYANAPLAGDCQKAAYTTLDHQAVETLYVRPSIDVHQTTSQAEDFQGLCITRVGGHDTVSNKTIQVVGALQPNPKDQTNMFQAWSANQVETSVDRFEMTADVLTMLELFRPEKGQTAMERMHEIVENLALSVTRIYGRPDMHILMDLVWHSMLSFNVFGQHLTRGWLEGVVVGDTRTGKSEAATRLSDFYQLGEVVSCEAASFAGIVGGLQQISGKEWAITWGAIPLNDRRLVVLDEMSGLTVEQISSMSSVRSSGVAELTKIQQERALARTRLLWLGNPRNGEAMSRYTYGVDALRPLVGNNEDVARYDLAMSVTSDEVSSEDINMAHDRVRPMFHQVAYQELVRWVWSRNPDQVLIAPAVEQHILKVAKAMGNRYIEDPPLVQAANFRMKLARMAVALAARTFSTDPTGQVVIVKPEHVTGVAQWLDHLYDNPNFGYRARSRERLDDAKLAKTHRSDAMSFLRNYPGLSKFLRSNAHFRRGDLEDVLNLNKEECNAIVNKLWGFRMLRKDHGMCQVEPALHDLLREVK